MGVWELGVCTYSTWQIEDIKAISRTDGFNFEMLDIFMLKSGHTSRTEVQNFMFGKSWCWEDARLWEDAVVS